MGGCASVAAADAATSHQKSPTAEGGGGDGGERMVMVAAKRWPGILRVDAPPIPPKEEPDPSDLLSVQPGVLPLAATNGQDNKAKLPNLAIVLGGPNSNKGAVLQHIQQDPSLDVTLVCAETLLIRYLRKNAAGDSIRDALDFAENASDTLTMQLLMQLVTEHLACDDNTPAPSSTPAERTRLVIIDLIPNLRVFSRAPLLRNPAKHLSIFERQVQRFRFALHLESSAVTTPLKRANTLPDEEDVRRLQKRSQMHQSNTFPLIKYFEDSERVISLKQTSSEPAPYAPASADDMLSAQTRHTSPRVKAVYTWLRAYMHGAADGIASMPQTYHDTAGDESAQATQFQLQRGGTQQQHRGAVVCMCSGDAEQELLRTTLADHNIACSPVALEDGGGHNRATLTFSLRDNISTALASSSSSSVVVVDTAQLKLDSGRVSVSHTSSKNIAQALVYCQAGQIRIGDTCVVDVEKADVHAHSVDGLLVLFSRKARQHEARILNMLSQA
ncbi:hypothetical protein PTSG_10142 [Salpingoeca rosetta]|uniref:Uncharacterized protein n=1 Tax=Salpingoeca rosetta (strain ATCC 50818 / BSB-021) TaxID=946362 RepID=F2UQF3_SALR5|nr:uncharacterized protein PTSG_10142 [Salpingoeca rosetta]EGD79858.1 hypothetical protein PTSG_10142 [Salpingoeca rosetta]|eukprot:XP_004988479.1 hypothetical protein PTSG_10142 [Salpingoeca rosetta]